MGCRDLVNSLVSNFIPLFHFRLNQCFGSSDIIWTKAVFSSGTDGQQAASALQGTVNSNSRVKLEFCGQTSKMDSTGMDEATSITTNFSYQTRTICRSLISKQNLFRLSVYVTVACLTNFCFASLSMPQWAANRRWELILCNLSFRWTKTEWLPLACCDFDLLCGQIR